jgi:hypothetical protein
MTVQQQKRGISSDWSDALNPLSVGELGYDTTNKILKIGDGSTLWASLPPINESFYYITNNGQALQLGTLEQDLIPSATLKLISNSMYKFEIQCTILTSTPATARNFDFAFYQTGMTAFSKIRYIWNLGTRTTSINYTSNTFVGTVGTTDLTTFYSSNTDPVLIFRINGMLVTGNGSSNFRPRIKFTNTDTSTRSVLSLSYFKVDYVGTSSAENIGWL